MPHKRPNPRFKNGHFVPAVPIPDPRGADDYSFFDIIKSVFVIARNPLEAQGLDGYTKPIAQFQFFKHTFTYINSPEAIRHCFIENRRNYRFQNIRKQVLGPVLRDGLITVEGDDWHHARRAMSPMFTPRNVKSFAATMKSTTERIIPDLLEHERPVQISPIMSALAYLVLSDTLFSGDIDEDQAFVLQNVATVLSHMGRPDPLDLIYAPDWIPRLSRIRGMKSVKNLRAMIRKVLLKRKAQQDSVESLPDDFLTRLLLVGDDNTRPFTNAQIEDHMLAFIAAGHETTARALSWLFYLLANDTKARDRLEAEVDALDIDTTPPEKWIEVLPYTLACFEETMRLYPPAPFIAREAIEADSFGDTNVPAGSVVMVNAWQLHRHKTLWDNPNAFIPERFLGKARERIDRLQYLPFGVGERVCIGQRFAMQEAVILIAILMRRYRFDYAGDIPPWPKMRITVQPENGMPMRVALR